MLNQLILNLCVLFLDVLFVKLVRIINSVFWTFAALINFDLVKLSSLRHIL